MVKPSKIMGSIENIQMKTNTYSEVINAEKQLAKVVQKRK
jgi:hypothetical protein